MYLNIYNYTIIDFKPLLNTYIVLGTLLEARRKTNKLVEDVSTSADELGRGHRKLKPISKIAYVFEMNSAAHEYDSSSTSPRSSVRPKRSVDSGDETLDLPQPNRITTGKYICIHFEIRSHQ